MALSATRVKALKEPGRYSDGAGLAPLRQPRGTQVVGPAHHRRRTPARYRTGRVPVRQPGSCPREGNGQPDRRCSGPRSPGREARACDADVQGSRTGRPCGEHTPLAQRQVHRQLDAGVGAPRHAGAGQHAARPSRPRGRAARPQPDMDDPAGDRPAGASADADRLPMGDSARLHGGQPGGRGHRRRVAPPCRR